MSYSKIDTQPPVSKYAYSEKFVSYIDILGWKALTDHDKITLELQHALAILDNKYRIYREDYEENFKKNINQNKEMLQERATQHGVPFEDIKIATPSKEIQCGIFSDGIIISKPRGTIFEEIAEISRDLLAIGLLCRGGITKGFCYHKENRLFGPAINEVVALEQKAKNPRILCDQKILKIAHALEQNHPMKLITDDPTTKKDEKILNLFPCVPVRFRDEDSNIKHILDYFRIPEIRKPPTSGKLSPLK